MEQTRIIYDLQFPWLLKANFTIQLQEGTFEISSYNSPGYSKLISPLNIDFGYTLQFPWLLKANFTLIIFPQSLAMVAYNSPGYSKLISPSGVIAQILG